MKNLNVPLALFAGFVGAALFHFVLPQPVQAETQAKAPQSIQAQSFVLVDPNGKTMGAFTYKPTRNDIAPPGIVLFDANGRQIWGAGLGPIPTSE